jgi:hypothetical protein
MYMYLCSFFSELDVCFVVMQWLPSTSRDQYKVMETQLRQNGLEPARSVHGSVYMPSNLYKDLNYVVWRKPV